MISTLDHSSDKYFDVSDVKYICHSGGVNIGNIFVCVQATFKGPPVHKSL